MNAMPSKRPDLSFVLSVAAAALLLVMAPIRRSSEQRPRARRAVPDERPFLAEVIAQRIANLVVKEFQELVARIHQI